MKKLIYLFLFLPLISKAQKTADFSFKIINERSGRVEVYILNKDSSIYYNRFIIRGTNNYFNDSIIPGVYNIKVIHKDSTTFYEPNVEFKENHITNIYFKDPSIFTRSKEYNVYNPDNKLSEIISLSFSGFNNSFDKLSPYNFSFSPKFEIGEFDNIGKYIAHGYLIGGACNYYYFNKEKSLNPTILHNTEKYTYLNVNALYFIRLQNYKKLLDENKGLFFDIGVNYNLPLAFRYVLKDGNTRYIKNRIHQYTDFSIVSKLGFKPISIILNYRLTDFLIRNYFELPQFSVGLCFDIEG